jgi:hypothetical protein
MMVEESGRVLVQDVLPLATMAGGAPGAPVGQWQ